MAAQTGEKKHGTTSQKVGLTLPVSRVEGALRRGNFTEQVGKASAVALTAVLEHVMGTLLNAAQGVAKEHDRQLVNNRHIQLAAQKDQRYTKLLNGFILIDGGVLPDVNPADLTKKKKRSKAKKTSANATPAVLRPAVKIAKTTKKETKAPKDKKSKATKTPKADAKKTKETKKPKAEAKPKKGKGKAE